MDAATILEHFATVADAPGGVARLRALVLELALCGRLVEQDPTDEPVATLLARVEAARTDAFASHGWRAGEASRPIGEDAKPWTIPAAWAWARLERLALPQAGFAFKSNLFNQSGRGTPLIRIRDIGNGTTECHFEGEFRSEFLVEPGDYLVGMDGNFNIRRWAGPTALLNQRVTRLIFFDDELDRSFTTWALQDRIRALHGSRAYTTVQHLSGKQVARAVIPVPPVGEQRRIVAKVDELMRLCDELESRHERRKRAAAQFRGSALNALLEAATTDDFRRAWERANTHWPALTGHPESAAALRKVGLQLLVQGRLAERSSKDEPAEALLQRARADRDDLIRRRLSRLVADDQSYLRTEPLPPGWSWAPLQDVVRLIDYRGRTPVKTSAGVPLITAKNIRRGYISAEPREFIAEADYDSWMTRGLPRVGDVLFTTEAPMGNAAMIRTPNTFALAQRTITLAPYADFSGAYLELLLLSPWFASELEKRATGMTATGIKAAKLRLIRVPVPPLDEQFRMVASMSRYLDLCSDLERSAARHSRAATALSAALTAVA